jgi:hypothetical protein
VGGVDLEGGPGVPSPVGEQPHALAGHRGVEGRLVVGLGGR